MGTLAVLFHFLLYFTASDFTQVSPPNFAGVFLLIDGGKYTYSFAGTADACRTVNATVATLKQVERALQLGLETCKYGWTAEQTAVIPRLTANKNCGVGKTGVVMWFANPDQKFGVFCFSAPDSEGAPITSTLRSSTSIAWTTPTSFSFTLSSTPTSPRSPTTSQTETTVSTTATSSPTTLPTSSPFSSSTSDPTTSRPTSPKPSTTRFSEQDIVVATTSLASSSFPPTPSIAMVTTATWSTSPAKPFLGGVSRTLLILGGILLLLAAAALVSYYKLNIFVPAGRLKDDGETEMWKHDDSEMALPSRSEEEDEEDRKYSGDILLCVNPTFRSDSSLV